jgi:CRISPR-associated endonuclease/helicase Cas3
VREIIAVCRSSKRSRVRVAAVLDRFFWRIGDRTWRGRASNACLDRVARELRAEAKRNTAVVIHEIRSARESRVPIVRIGSRLAFSPEGVVPVVVRTAGAGVRYGRSESERARLAIVRIAILFHDLGKATILFQEKLRRGLKKRVKPEADPVRHELLSALVWDELVGAHDDADLIKKLGELKPGHIDDAFKAVVARARSYYNNPNSAMKLAFAERDGSPANCEGTIAYAIGMLILTHHRLPDGSGNHLRLQAGAHVNHDAALNDANLKIAEGAPFWHSKKWLSRLRKAAECLQPGQGVPGLDIALRASLMFSDHLGSALSEARDIKSVARNEHLGNTRDGKPGDTLEAHVDRVWQRALGSYDMLHRHRERYPALDEDQVPIDIRHPEAAPEPFAWQAIAANEARNLCEEREGGFFACLMAGTGTGKTRGAPTVLASAAFGDARSERRYLRITLALGLRSLATQSADEYVNDLRFDQNDVSVLIGRPPVRFKEDEEEDSLVGGSESLLALPEWLRVERAGGGPPREGDKREADWLRRLSVDTDRGLPATLDSILEHDRTGAPSARLLTTSPIIVGTVDHLMGVASPVRSRYLVPALRVLTSDLILDEIDQYDPEDIAAIGRLVYQAAAGGRRVIIMSATLTADVACALHQAYRQGWSAYAAASSLDEHVNVLCCSEAAGSCATNANGEAFESLYENCKTATISSLEEGPPRRLGKILPVRATWNELVGQIDTEASVLHDSTAGEVEGLRVSIGFVRLTRIAHAAALAVQLPAGPRNDRLRLKVCLHSQFPRLHRAWIENELKKALTRKERDPDSKLHEFCHRHRLIERVREEGCSELEIVVVTSPVIETGNDLDFDWAIIDPSSMRTIVQAAGRVWRHREYPSSAPNVAILGQSAVVMQMGKLELPGVETTPHPCTGVLRIDLNEFGDRLLVDLTGPDTFDRIDARAILGAGMVPLRDKEAQLRCNFIAVDGDDAPLGTYIRHPTARLNCRMTQTRVFRRSTTRDLLYFKDGENLPDAAWMLDLAPGTRNSAPRQAVEHGLQVINASEPSLVFPDLEELAWKSQRQEFETPTTNQLRRLTQVRVPEYGDRSEQLEPSVTYWEWTGFTRGCPQDLSGPFGKTDAN